MQLKISSISNLTDARYFSAIGAQYLGFCFDVMNENNITIEKAKEIINWLHEPTIVGEFGSHQSKEEIQFIALEVGLHAIQIPFDHPQKNKMEFEKFLVVDSQWSMDHGLSTIDSLVLKISEEDLHHPRLKEIISSSKTFIETDFTKGNILTITDSLQPFGIQLSCKKEERAGLSNMDEYAEILEMIGFV